LQFWMIHLLYPKFEIQFAFKFELLFFFEFSMKKLLNIWIPYVYKYKITSMQTYSSNYQVCSPISLKSLIVILLNF
jgi:hypothetical protein